MASVAANRAHSLPVHRIARVVAAGLVLAGIGVAVWRAQVSAMPSGALVASGTIEAEETNIGVEVAGRIARLEATEGDVVRRGALLIGLDDAVARAQLSQAQAGVAAARANLALVESGARSEDVRGAEASLAQAGAARVAAEKALNNARVLRDNPQELDAKISQAEAGVDAATARLDQVLAGPRASELAAVRAAHQQALEGVQSADSRLNLLRQGARAEDVRAAELALDQAKNILWSTQTSRDGACGNQSNPRYLCDAAKSQVAAAETAVQSAENSVQRVRNELRRRLLGTIVEIVLRETAPALLRQARDSARQLPGVTGAQLFGDRLHVLVSHAEGVAALQGSLGDRVSVASATRVEPTMEDVFLALRETEA